MNVKLQGKSINYQLEGTGSPLLLIHGWGGSSKSLEPLAQSLAKKYKAITIDLPGFGKSSKPDPDWGVEEYAKIIIDFISEFKLRPVIFFGHSFGGALGVYLAAKYPEYISKLILSGASYKRNNPASAKAVAFLKWIPPLAKKIIYKVLFPQSDLYKVPELETNFRKIVTQDLTPLIQTIKTPTLILWGEKDNQTPVSNAIELQNKINSSGLKIFLNIGHNLPLKYPRLVYEEITKFL